MELRTCSTLHFIQAIRHGLVVKMHNVNSHGTPALVFKKLKDIYETTATKESQAFSTLNSPEKYADSVCGLDSVKSESQSLPVADRTLREMDTENNEFVCCASADEDDDSDSNDYIFVKMTLKQLKERCKSKKRKLPSLFDAIPNHEDFNFQQEEDEDLKVPLSVFKTRLSKNSKTKRRCINKSAFPCSKTAISVKMEQILNPDVAMQFKGDSASLANVKAEVPEHEYSSCPSTGSLASISSEVPLLSDVDSLPSVELRAQAHKPEFSGHQSTNTFTDCFSINCNEESSCSGLISSEVPETVGVQGEVPMFFAEKHQCCTLEDVSTNDNLECVGPKFYFPQSVVDAETNTLKTRFEIYNQPHPHGGSLEIILPPKDKNMDMHLNQHVISVQNNCDFESHVSDAILTGKVDSTGIHHADDIYMPEEEVKEDFCSSQQNVSTTSPLEKIFSSGDFPINSSTDDDLISVKGSPSSVKRLSKYSSADTGNSCLNPSSLQGESSKVEGKKSPSVVEEKNFTIKSQPSNVASMIPTSELQQPPKRLPSMRKAISPSSQEGLCLAMNSAGLFDEAENYKRKEKLLVGQGMLSCGTDENSKLSSQVCQPKAFIRRKEIAKRLKISQKGFPQKGNSESPHFSRSLHQLSTGCTSIDSCSESAIAFSQWQMHDFESLAMKLMDELKSMKDMIEQKLLFEAYRKVYLKNEADEVINAINNTMKVEETARKWLSMMTRDCTRFCRLMEMQKLSQSGGASSRGTVRKERKITFADEAGGTLCTVNYFDDTVSSPMQLYDEKQEG